MRPVKGQILAFDNAIALVRHVLFREDVYLVPRLSGECLFGATVEDGVADRDVTLQGLRWLLEQAFETAPGLAGLRFLRAWAGLRPATEDGLPVVGPWPGAPGLLVATGHYRNGILFTPVTARLIRDYVVGGTVVLCLRRRSCRTGWRGGGDRMPSCTARRPRRIPAASSA